MLRDPHRTLEDIERLPTKTMVGERLDGRYELKEIIGEGGMGVVFKATQLSVNRDVAIKVMKSELFEEFGLMKRFKLEMEIISSLQHPNIVRLLDTGIDARLGVVFLVMEFIEGVCLGDLLYNTSPTHTLASELAIEIAIQVCSALTEPHRLGVIHRDLKPDNIILTVRSDEQLDVKLLDFGVARIISPNERIDTTDTGRLTATGGIVGTPPYIAPELCESSRSVSIKSDLYAVGALLFELLTGFPPFVGRSTAEVFFKHVHEPAPLLLDVSPIPGCACEDLEALIANLLAKDPDQRPDSALHVKRELDKIRQQNKLPRPTLTYTESAPTVASFYRYVGTIDELIETQGAQVPTLDTPAPKLGQAAHPKTRDSHPIVAADNTSSMEIPRATPGMTSHSSDFLDEQDGAYTYEMEVPIEAPRARKPAVIIAALLGVAILVGVVIMSQQDDTSTDTDPTETPQPITTEVEPLTQDEAPTKEAPSPLTPPDLTPALTHSSSTLHDAIVKALESSSPPAKPAPTRDIKAKKTTEPVDSKPATSDTPKPNKIKKNIDWLYKK